MKKLLSCAFNMDSGCVELKFNNGSMIAINCTAVENEVADNMCKRSELDYLIYNDSLAYANLVLNGNPDINVNLKMYSFDHLRMYNIDHINTFCSRW